MKINLLKHRGEVQPMSPEGNKKTRAPAKALGYFDEMIEMNLALDRAMNEAISKGSAIDPRNRRRFRMIKKPYQGPCRIVLARRKGQTYRSNAGSSEAYTFLFEYVDESQAADAGPSPANPA